MSVIVAMETFARNALKISHLMEIIVNVLLSIAKYAILPYKMFVMNVKMDILSITVQNNAYALQIIVWNVCMI